jgi:hypothetical protein
MARFSDFVELKPFKSKRTNTYVVFALYGGMGFFIFLKFNVKGYTNPIRDDGFK